MEFADDVYYEKPARRPGVLDSVVIGSMPTRRLSVLDAIASLDKPARGPESLDWTSSLNTQKTYSMKRLRGGLMSSTRRLRQNACEEAWYPR